LAQTREFLHLLEATVRQAQQDWLNRVYEDPNPHAHAIKNAAALAVAGYVETLRNEIINIQEDDGNAE
jgi:hypothetical protein